MLVSCNFGFGTHKIQISYRSSTIKARASETWSRSHIGVLKVVGNPFLLRLGVAHLPIGARAGRFTTLKVAANA